MQTRVAVFTSRRLVVQQGRDLGRGPDARWAMVGIPEDASSESIVLALVEIEPATRRSYVMPILLDAAARAAAVS